MITGIPFLEVEYEKQGSKWVIVETTKKIVNEEYVNNIIMAKRFFTGLGGYERHESDYTKHGYRVIRTISISPDKTRKIVREFNFDEAN